LTVYDIAIDFNESYGWNWWPLGSHKSSSKMGLLPTLLILSKIGVQATWPNLAYWSLLAYYGMCRAAWRESNKLAHNPIGSLRQWPIWTRSSSSLFKAVLGSGPGWRLWLKLEVLRIIKEIPYKGIYFIFQVVRI